MRLKQDEFYNVLVRPTVVIVTMSFSIAEYKELVDSSQYA